MTLASLKPYYSTISVFWLNSKIQKKSKYHKTFYYDKYMYSTNICVVIWIDRKLITLIFTSICFILNDDEIFTISPYVSETNVELSTSHVNLEYTTYIKGVDVMDQLRGEYYCQICSHVWWCRIFFYLTPQWWMSTFYITIQICVYHNYKWITLIFVFYGFDNDKK